MLFVNKNNILINYLKICKITTITKMNVKFIKNDEMNNEKYNKNIIFAHLIYIYIYFKNKTFVAYCLRWTFFFEEYNITTLLSTQLRIVSYI